MLKKVLVACLSVAVLAGVAFAAKYPTKKINFIVPFAAGGGTDAVARKVADVLKKELGQDIVVINQVGGSGAVGMTDGSKKKGDGYNVTIVTRELSWLYQMKLAPVTPNDFKAVGLVNEDPAVLLVRKDSKFKTVKELVDYAKKNPGKLKFASTAKPNFYLLAVEINQGISFNQIPYNGAAEALPALLGGHVDLTMMSPGEAFAQIKDGSLRALAVASDVRFAGLPNVPTFKEQGMNVITGTWRGLAVPKNTPDDIVKILSDALSKTVNSDDFKNFMSTRNFGVRYLNSIDFQNFMNTDSQNLKAVVEEIQKQNSAAAK
ncbi:MAG: tripartite tricarboxylate transporter substrate binding protein [Elusimicrobiota bacterium]|nr:tripartite tricarboxylate transporter substrate binding protein [Elusimicrobiota bacterium]